MLISENGHHNGSPSRRTRILLADDHRVVIEGLRLILEPEFEVIGMVEDGLSLLKSVQELEPDVVIADISMPKLNGIAALQRIGNEHPDAKVIILTMHNEIPYAVDALGAGAVGYVLKHSAASELRQAITDVVQGKKYISPTIAQELVHVYREGTVRRTDGATFTPRQREVLQLLAEGKSAKDVARTLGISARTVEYHKYKMMRKVCVNSAIELVQYAIKHGLLTL